MILRNFRRFISFFLVFTFFITFLSGCIAKEKPQKTGQTERVKLVYYKLFDEEDVMAPLIKKYVVKHPNVSIEYRKFTNPEEYENLIINELAEGEGPDIFSAPNYWFLRHNRKISPLPPDKVSVKKFEDTFVTVAANDLVLRDRSDGQLKVYGIPLAVDTLALYYNKAAFDDRLPSKGHPSETWEGIKDDVFQLNKKDNSFERFEVAGIAMGRFDNISRAVEILYLLMLQNNVKLYNENISQAVFADQSNVSVSGARLNPAVDALRLYTSFALPANKNYSWNAYLADSKSSVKELETFARGKVAMIFGYSYLYQQIQDEIKDLRAKGVATIDSKDVKIAPVPQMMDPKTSTEKRVSYAQYFAETVSRTSQHPDIAWDFLSFISTKENLQYYHEKTNRPTSRRDLIEEQQKDPIYGVFAQQIGYSESFPVYDSTLYQQVFGKAIDAALATVSLLDALRTAEAEINDVLPAQGLLAPEPETKGSAAPSPTQKTQQNNNNG